MQPDWRAWRKVPLRNWKWKLLALVLAMFTWYAIQGATSNEAEIQDVPLVIKAGEGWAVLSRSADAVTVSFRGSQEDLLRLNRDNLEVTLDVSGQSREGAVTLLLDARDIKIPSGVRVARIRPAQVTLRLDRRGSRVVPVKVDLKGAPPEGYDIEKVVCTPASVGVSGPRLMLDKVEAVRTQPLNLDKRNHSFTERVALMPPGEMWDATLEPAKVSVDIYVVERAEYVILENVNVLALVAPGARFALALRPDKVTVKLAGRRERLAQLAAGDVKVYVDCVNLEWPARYDLPVRVHPPAGVRLESVDPATLAVSLGVE